jgi:hypothetical protein
VEGISSAALVSGYMWGDNHPGSSVGVRGCQVDESGTLTRRSVWWPLTCSSVIGGSGGCGGCGNCHGRWRVWPHCRQKPERRGPGERHRFRIWWKWIGLPNPGRGRRLCSPGMRVTNDTFREWPRRRLASTGPILAGSEPLGSGDGDPVAATSFVRSSGAARSHQRLP